ncbi:MAG: hypothetical protein ACRESW_02280 [Nevskiales bacterium]
MNQAVREHLEKQKLEQVRWQETLQALEALRQRRLFSGETVHTWLKSWGSVKELPPRHWRSSE